jgi:hypothetical protein
VGATAAGRHSNRALIGALVAAALMLLGVVVWATDAVHLSSDPRITVGPKVGPVFVGPADVIVPVRWKQRDLTPAARAGRICTDAAQHGRICATYDVGDRPADRLTVEIERRGLHVQATR